MSRLFSAATTTAILMTLGAALFTGDTGRAETPAPGPVMAAAPAMPQMVLARAGTIGPMPTPEAHSPAAALPELPTVVADGPAARTETASGAPRAIGARLARGGSLDTLVASHAMPASVDSELRCLATAVYFEAKSEPLKGQLAVAHVVRERAASGKFPTTLCGVVKQRGQFSFVRGGQLPSVPTGTRDWREAVAVAEIALADAVASPVPGALFFHATHVSPGWKRARVGQVQNHIFYR